jgi:hypothetical protein
LQRQDHIPFRAAFTLLFFLEYTDGPMAIPGGMPYFYAGESIERNTF